MNLKGYLKEIPHLSLISRIARQRKVNIWLVGGFLRDIYLKKDVDLFDFDFCVESNAVSIAREFAEKIFSKCIMLDEVQESLRVILKKKDKLYTYDFTLIRGGSLYQDLSLRDFSINTLAVNLKEREAKIIDYFGARKDLKHKVIKVIKEEVIPQDPLRILRGFAFVACYGFHIENKTLKLMFKFKKLIKKVSKERVNEELFKILASPNSFKTIKMMDKLRIIDEIIPYIDKMRGVSQGAYHHLDVWEHSLDTLRQFEILCQRRLAKKKEIVAYLNEELAKDRRYIQIIKLACLLHDVGKPFAVRREKKKTIFHTHEKIGRDLAEEISSNLRLSWREREVLEKLIFWHLRPGYLADQVNPTKRAIYRFFRDTQNEGIAVILLSLSDWRATRGPLTSAKKRKKHEKIMFKLIDKYFEERKKKPLPKIVDGYDIMQKFKLKSSPLIGKILKKIREEQALGKISYKAEAYKVAKKVLAKVK